MRERDGGFKVSERFLTDQAETNRQRACQSVDRREKRRRTKEDIDPLERCTNSRDDRGRG